MRGEASASRLFFALWPDDDVRDRLVAEQRRLQAVFPRARWIPRQRLHQTLHFLGRLSPRQRRQARDDAEAIEGACFELALDRLGCFERARVLWIGPSRMPTALLDLHARLGERLAGIGYRMQFEAYRPHVTLARKLRSIPPGVAAAEPIRWSVRDFALVESVDRPGGVAYRVIERYPLERRAGIR